MKKIISTLFFVIPVLLYSNPYIETGTGIGQYKYLEYNAVTYFRMNTSDYSNIWTLGARTYCGSEYIYCAPDKGSVQGTGISFDASDYNSSNSSGWAAGAIYYVSVYAQYGNNGSGGWSHSPGQTGFNEISLRIIDISTSTLGLASTIVDNPSGSQNLVMNFKIDATVDETLKRFWVKNNGTAQETSDIPNAGIKLYYENVTGSEIFGGDESSATLYGNYNNNPTDNEYWGHDALGIPIPIGGLRCYLVIVDLTSEYNPAHTTNFAIINNGISLNYGLMRIDETISGGDPATLPVTLSTFTAQYLNSKPTLYWTTQSEIDNMGWFVYRNKIEDFTSATKVSGMIEGHGTTTQAQSYIYEDVIADPQVGDVYYYWLESVDYSGTIHHFDKVAMITIPETNDPNPNVTPPKVYDLLASPNPFNESTKISFTLTQSAMVDVAIYDVKGALVKSFDTQHVTANDEVLLKWYGNDENSKSLSNGIYLYSVKVNGQEYSTKQLILMK